MKPRRQTIDEFAAALPQTAVIECRPPIEPLSIRAPEELALIAAELEEYGARCQDPGSPDFGRIAGLILRISASSEACKAAFPSRQTDEGRISPRIYLRALEFWIRRAWNNDGDGSTEEDKEATARSWARSTKSIELAAYNKALKDSCRNSIEFEVIRRIERSGGAITKEEVLGGLLRGVDAARQLLASQPNRSRKKLG